MRAWTPRPPAVDEPACWSWPLPPLRDAEEEFQRLVAAQEGLPVDERRDPRAFRFHLDDMVSYRFAEFHQVGDDALDCWCAICGLQATTEDHCHDTGQTRGWLCRSCNVIEGRSNLPLFIRYRRIHPAAIVDLHDMYSGFGWEWGWQYGDRRTSRIRPATPWPVWSPDAPLDAEVPC
jgi:hypothetical protein